MAVPTNTFQTYQAIGNREDLIDIITNISPDATPFFSAISSTRATATTHEWQTDALDTPAANAQIEGDDTSNTAVTPTVRLSNYTQILKKAYGISGTQEAVKHAGRANEMAYQMQKAMRGIATDVEYALVMNASAVGGASGTARQLKGLKGWVATNESSATADRDLTSTILDGAHQLAWASGGNPDMVLCSGFQKKQFANATNFPGMTRQVSAESAKIANAVEIYEGSFGTLTVKLSHVMNSDSTLKKWVFGVETQRFLTAWLRPFERQPLAKTGDSVREQIIGECTLEARNEKSSFVIKNLNAA